MKRIYEELLREHVSQNRQMAMLTGPRQVGKTTSSRAVDESCAYLTWDNPDDKKTIVAGPNRVAERLGLSDLISSPKLLILDEVHKYGRWKSFLKGLYDTHGDKSRIIVTGSARMNVYKRGGDSLMGRYFLYRMHPLSVGELASPCLRKSVINLPRKIGTDELQRLLEFGGFPEPFLKSDRRFYNRWRRLRTEQLFFEDIRDLTKISEISQMIMLADLLRERSGRLLNMSRLSSDIQVTVDTIRRWIETLDSMYYCFIVRPWFSNVPKSIRKQPKVYLWDWSLLSDKGARAENFIASHLLKAVHFWTDSGFGEFGLSFLRDKEKREVDFVITKDKKPFILVEAKSSGNAGLSASLEYFQKKLNVPHAFQVSMDMNFVERDCFAEKKPVRVPALTLLSQLI